jgi:hypothetical protein
MKKDDLISLLSSDLSLARADSTLVNERTKALDYYLGEPIGTEVEGRSQVVSSEVSDTIEWILPQLLKIFTSTDDVVVFDAERPEDEEAARQQSDYLNYVFYKENDGFDILYVWFKDALMSKDGVVKYYYDETDKKQTEDYEGLPEMEYMLLANDPEVEITGFEEVEVNGQILYNCNVIRTETKGKIVIEVIPPEEFRIDPNFASSNIQDCDFCAHVTKKTLSRLKEEGYDVSKIEDISGNVDADPTGEKSARFDTSYFANENHTTDKSMREVEVAECIKRVDFDGDGIAELRKIILVNDKHILENEEINYVPFESITPIPMPHRFHGRSVADLVTDLQEIKTTLMRNILDNLYLINNTRTAVVDGEVNLEDLLDSRPGGVVRMTAPGMAQPLTTQPFTGHAFGMLEYLDSVRENRTGVTRYNQGLDANSLNKTATGINRIMDASQERINLIARIFGNGLKRLMIGIHRLALQNIDVEKTIKLRNKWVTVNPSEWKERENMTVTVGLGTGDKEKQKESLMMILAQQKEAMAAGGDNFVEPKHILYTFRKLIEASGFTDSNMFFNDPEQVQPKQEQPDPQMMMMQMQAQIANQQNEIKMMEAQIEAQKVQADIKAQEKQMELKEIDLQRKIQQDETKTRFEEDRLDVDETDKQKNAQEAERKLVLEKEKIALDVKLKERELELKEKELEMDYEKQIQDFNLKVNEQMSPVVQSIAELQANMNAPKRVVRDDKGDIVGVEIAKE